MDGVLYCSLYSCLPYYQTLYHLEYTNLLGNLRRPRLPHARRIAFSEALPKKAGVLLITAPQGSDQVNTRNALWLTLLLD